MELLKTIKDENLGFSHKEGVSYKKRKAVRAIVFDNEGRIALLNVAKHNYHKLPGGGVEEGEALPEALNRETLEEVGCNVEITGEVGRIVEFRDEFKEEQESLCYLAKVIGEKGSSNFTEKEVSQGFNVLWANPTEAVKILDEDKPSNYEGEFIKARDTILLKRALEISKN
ncbi:MAG: NUDIX domain-containing protein [Candidatus Moranbacteria bacterium]|nr:NUDIX domain-containing protein [Candidatus Moranbacteria bacterium]